MILMSDWRDQLSGAGQEAVNRENKQSQERRDKDRAERLRAENRMALARRLVNTPPTTGPRGRDAINMQSARLMSKAPAWAQPPPPTQQEIKREALITQKREHENALIKVNQLLRFTMPIAKYRECCVSRDSHVRAIGKIENELRKLTEKQTNKQKYNNIMKHEITNVPANPEHEGDTVMIGDTVVKGHRVNGELLFKVEDMREVLMKWASDLPKQTENAILPRAEDARKAVNELLDRLGMDMGDFRKLTKEFIEDIRQSRFTIVAEASTMSKSLREVRQFFIDKDYKEEITRLREFVELCERLVALKQNGTLDAITDTILKLSV
jgi:hypothetical protein